MQTKKPIISFFAEHFPQFVFHKESRPNLIFREEQTKKIYRYILIQRDGASNGLFVSVAATYDPEWVGHPWLWPLGKDAYLFELKMGTRAIDLLKFWSFYAPTPEGLNKALISISNDLKQYAFPFYEQIEEKLLSNHVLQTSLFEARRTSLDDITEVLSAYREECAKAPNKSLEVKAFKHTKFLQIVDAVRNLVPSDISGEENEWMASIVYRCLLFCFNQNQKTNILKDSASAINKQTKEKKENSKPMDHNKVIYNISKKALSPLGLKRQGKSRSWYDDQGCWGIIVEFQSSSWSKGSYLNVGLSWMFYEQHHWSFDIGHREDGFKSAENDEHFEAAMIDVAAHAAQLVKSYRERFSSLDKMCEHYRKNKCVGIWDYYYAGVLEGLRGNQEIARQRFLEVINGKDSRTTGWVRGLQFRCQDLIRLLDKPDYFSDSILGIVVRSRVAHFLPDMPVEEMRLS